MAFFASGLVNALKGIGNKIRRPQDNSTVSSATPKTVTLPSDPTIPLNSRPTAPIAAPSEYERLVSLGRRLSADPTLDEHGGTIRRPGRFKSGLMQLANAVGEAARTNVAAGRTDWSDMAGVAGAGVGGMGIGVADPGLIVKARHEQAIARNKKAQEDELGRTTGLAKIKGIEAEAARDQAYAAANTPEGVKAKADAKKAIDEAKNFSDAM
jgi:hypothetical protein